MMKGIVEIELGRHRRWRSLIAPLGLCISLSGPVEASPPVGRGMPDVSKMSGIALMDGRTPSGSVVVRCLYGSFARPAVGVEVELEVRASEDAEAQVFRAKTVDRGRAIFEGLEGFSGGSAIARVQLGAHRLVSETLPIQAQTGTAVMLVGSAADAPEGGEVGSMPTHLPNGTAIVGDGADASKGQPPISAHGSTGGVPMPGRPFPLPERPAGTVIVGALDIGLGVPVPGTRVELHIERPGQGVEILEQRANEDGRVVFTEITGPEYPQGTKLTAHAFLVEDEAALVSETFDLPVDQGVAVVLTIGHSNSPAPPASDAGHRPARERVPRLPGPRRDASVAAGYVRVEVVDEAGQALGNQQVEVVRQGMAGGGESVRGVTDAKGIVDIAVDTTPGSLYFAGAVREGAPYRSGLFEIPSDVGAHVNLRVWLPTADRSQFRSVVQFDLEPRENDKLLVRQIYAVMHDGDRAYWPPGGLRIDAPPGAVSLQILPGSTKWLEVSEGASFMELARPLPPGEEVRLSFAYLIDHSGVADIHWQAPFPMVKAMVSLDEELKLTGGTHGPPKPAPAGYEGVQIYEFSPEPYQAGLCAGLADAGHECPPALAAGGTPFDFAVAGLPTTGKSMRNVAVGLAALFLLVTVVGLALHRREDTRVLLMRERDELLQQLRRAGLSETERKELLATLDRIYHQIDALGSGPEPSDSAPTGAQG